MAIRGWQETALGFALTVRYTFGYLAAACLLSAPIQLARRVTNWQDKVVPIMVSMTYGAVFAGLFAAMIPMTRVDWSKMRLPEFKIFELAVARNALVVALAGLAISWTQDGTLFRVDMWTTVVVLMAFAYGNLKAQTLLFRDFYRDALDRKKTGSLLADLEPPETQLPDLDSDDEPAPTTPSGAAPSTPTPGPTPGGGPGATDG